MAVPRTIPRLRVRSGLRTLSSSLENIPTPDEVIDRRRRNYRLRKPGAIGLAAAVRPIAHVVDTRWNGDAYTRRRLAAEKVNDRGDAFVLAGGAAIPPGPRRRR
jgi:hypothetical protein